MSPDPYNGSYDVNNPQSFNRYAYVLDSPQSATDPSGLCPPAGRNGQPQPCISGGDAVEAELDYQLLAVLYEDSGGETYQQSQEWLPNDGTLTLYPGVKGLEQDPAGLYAYPSLGEMVEWSLDMGPTVASLLNGMSHYGYLSSANSGPGGGVEAPNKPQQAQKPPCSNTTRIAGAVKAAEAAGDASIAYNLSAIHFGAAGVLFTLGCLDPTPLDAVTCVPSVAGSAFFGAGGLILGHLGNMEVEDGVIPGIKQAVTCTP